MGRPCGSKSLIARTKCLQRSSVGMVIVGRFHPCPPFNAGMLHKVRAVGQWAIYTRNQVNRSVYCKGNVAPPTSIPAARAVAIARQDPTCGGSRTGCEAGAPSLRCISLIDWPGPSGSGLFSRSANTGLPQLGRKGPAGTPSPRLAARGKCAVFGASQLAIAPPGPLGGASFAYRAVPQHRRVSQGA